MTGGYGEKMRPLNLFHQPIDEVRDEAAPRPHSFTGVAPGRVVKNLLAQFRRSLRHRPAFLASVDQVEKHRVALVTPRLGKRPARERILMKQLADGVLQTVLPELLPLLLMRAQASRSEGDQKIVHRVLDVALGQERIAVIQKPFVKYVGIDPRGGLGKRLLPHVPP